MFNPRATYRLQFHKGFTFNHARQLLPYLEDLGISHVYASPIFRATPGSLHGYDVCNHNEINPEIGTREEFDAFADDLKSRGMGLILDFVPNHMGIEHGLNPWWRDILENGPASLYARYFDIDWQPLKRELENKVLLPLLGTQYGEALETGQLRVGYHDGVFQLHYGELVLPLALRSVVPILLRMVELLDPPPAELESIITAINHLPPRQALPKEEMLIRARERQVIRDRLTRLCSEQPNVVEAMAGVLQELNEGEDPTRYDRLDSILLNQCYRLSFWRVAGEEINYRRFFDVNTLAAIRVELPEVFDETHRLLLELVDAGKIDGIRIDHIDGLADPAGYLAKLRERCGDKIHIYVEKILAPDEKLPPEWPVQGTTGYEFANSLVQLLVSPGGLTKLTSVYDRFIGFTLSYDEITYRSKNLVMMSSMESEINVLGHLLSRIAESNRWSRDFTGRALREAVREVIACFPRYRTYIDPSREPTSIDVKAIGRAITLARKRNPARERTVFEFVRNVLIPPADNPHPVDEDLRETFVRKFQQCTGPITAKGIEDTSFYVYNRLAALNEVGGEPTASGLTISAFHRCNQERHSEHPANLLASTTHDTKRSEDTRMRIAAISEVAEEWGRAVRRWHTMNRKYTSQIEGETAPDRNEEYLLYQTLLGCWPLEDHNNRGVFIARIKDYMQKALREAKINSSWLEPNEAWENATYLFIEKILSDASSNRFPRTIAPLAATVAQLGAINGLAQTVLKLTSPGVPDFYQGTEIWDLSLVDPDNRRPVNYKLRAELLGDLSNPDLRDLLENWKDGRIKMFTISRLLQARRERSELFTGSYEALFAEGDFSDHVVAFARNSDAGRLLVVVPRHTARVGFPPIGTSWGDTRLKNPAQKWRNLFTGQTIGGEWLALSELMAEIPFAVLISTVD